MTKGEIDANSQEPGGKIHSGTAHGGTPGAAQGAAHHLNLPTRETALKDFFAAWTPKPCEVEIVSLDDSVGRILARDITSKNTIPVYRSSGRDGIAVKSTAFANGAPDTSAWVRGVDYVRADTGDDFPDDFDAVIEIEQVEINEDGSVTLKNPDKIAESIRPGACVRPAGSTVRAGSLVMKAGLPIRPTDLGAIIMAGANMVPVRRRPRVAVIPTGSELVSPGVKPLRGQNVDSNSLMLKHMLIEAGAQPIVYPIIKDVRADLEEAFEQALSAADLVVVNGGSSAGEEDINVAMIRARGRVIHHNIAAVPGRPMMLAVCDDKPVVVLPGPALAAYYGMEWCLSAIVARMLDIPVRRHSTISARAASAESNPAHMANIGRCEVVRAGDAGDGYQVEFFNFRSGQLMECLTSNAQRISPIGEGSWEAGDTLEVELLRSPEYLS